MSFQHGEIPGIENKETRGYQFNAESVITNLDHYPEIARIFLNHEIKLEVERRWDFLDRKMLNGYEVKNNGDQIKYYIDWLVSNGVYKPTNKKDIVGEFYASREAYRNRVTTELDEHENKISFLSNLSNETLKNEEFQLENVRYKLVSTKERFHRDFLDHFENKMINQEKSSIEFRALVEQFGMAMENLVNLILRYKVDTAVFLDKSARPYAWLMKDVIRNLNLEMPEIYFMNFGNEKKSGYTPNEFEIAYIKNRFKDKKVLVLDEVSIGGGSLDGAVKVLQQNSSGCTFVKSAIFDKDNIPFVENDFSSGVYDVDELATSFFLDELNIEQLVSEDSLTTVSPSGQILTLDEKYKFSESAKKKLAEYTQSHNNHAKVRLEFKSLAKELTERFLLGKNRSKFIKPLYRKINEF